MQAPGTTSIISWRRLQSRVSIVEKGRLRRQISNYISFFLDGKRQRPYDTVKPLADDLGLAVDTSCDRDDSGCVADFVEDYSGDGNILIWLALHYSVLPMSY